MQIFSVSNAPLYWKRIKRGLNVQIWGSIPWGKAADAVACITRISECGCSRGEAASSDCILCVAACTRVYIERACYTRTRTRSMKQRCIRRCKIYFEIIPYSRSRERVTFSLELSDDRVCRRNQQLAIWISQYRGTAVL